MVLQSSLKGHFVNSVSADFEKHVMELLRRLMSGWNIGISKIHFFSDDIPNCVEVELSKHVLSELDLDLLLCGLAKSTHLQKLILFDNHFIVGDVRRISNALAGSNVRLLVLTQSV